MQIISISVHVDDAGEGWGATPEALNKRKLA